MESIQLLLQTFNVEYHFYTYIMAYLQVVNNLPMTVLQNLLVVSVVDFYVEHDSRQHYY
jgi:hypothetical protein